MKKNLGFERKVKDLDRKNMVRIELTEKGLELYRKSSRRESIKSIVSILSSDEQTELRFLLSKLHDKALKHLGLKLPNKLKSKST